MDAISAVLDFIGSRESASRSATEYKKQYDGGLEDSFSNWEELLVRLKSNPFVAAPSASYQQS